MFGRATIRLGIGPHSSLCIFSNTLLLLKTVNMQQCTDHQTESDMKHHSLATTLPNMQMYIHEAQRHRAIGSLVGVNVPFQHKYGYIRDEHRAVS